MTSLSQIEGIGAVYAKKLEKKGVKTTRSLLAHGYNRKGRKELAQATGISEKEILQWVNHADMMQVRGVGPEYAGLLESAGVDTTKELAHRNPENLAKKIEEVNQGRNLVRKLPTSKQITAWILNATAIHRAPRGLAGDADIDAPPPPTKIYILEH